MDDNLRYRLDEVFIKCKPNFKVNELYTNKLWHLIRTRFMLIKVQCGRSYMDEYLVFKHTERIGELADSFLVWLINRNEAASSLQRYANPIFNSIMHNFYKRIPNYTDKQLENGKQVCKEIDYIFDKMCKGVNK